MVGFWFVFFFNPTVMWNEGNRKGANTIFTHNCILLIVENYQVFNPAQFQAFSSIFFF